MLVRTLLALAAIAVALLVFFSPWRGDDAATQPAAEPAAALAPLTPVAQDPVSLERPEEAASSEARTERLAEESKPVGARTFSSTVTGRVVDSRGRPLTRATLTHGGQSISSGRDGRFQLELVLPLSQRGKGQTLVASMEWYVTRDLEFEAAEQVELGDVVLAAAGSFSGRVVDVQGNGVAGAEVLVTNVVQIAFVSRDRRPSKPLQETHADNSGAFTLAGLTPGDVRLWAGAPGMLWAYTDDLRVKAGEDTTDIVLRLEPRSEQQEITLLVLDPGGEPVPYARIAYHDDGEGRSSSGSDSADELGRYRHPIRFNGTHDFTASDPDGRYRPATARSVPSGATGRILQLGQPEELQINVFERGNEPVEEFSVRCSIWIGEHLLMGQPARPEDDETPGLVRIQLPLDTFEISVDAKGYQKWTMPLLNPDTVGPSIDVLLVSLPGVKGRVVDGAGRGIEGALVGLHEAVGDRDTLEVNGFPCRSRKAASASATTDADGRFDLTLRLPGSFYLRATRDGLAPGEAGPFDLAPDLATGGLEVVLGEGGTLAGRVIAALGTSPAGRIVGISRADGHGVTQRTGEDGSYRFTHLTPGRWLVQGRRDEISANSTTSSSGAGDGPQRLSWSCSVMEGQVTRFDLDLSRAGAVVLEGSFLFSGAPVVGWQVMLSGQSNGQRMATDTIDSQGSFRLELDQPGTYKLQIAGNWEESPFFFVTQTLELGEGTQSWIRDLPLGRIEGTTTFALGDRLNYSWSGDEELRIFCRFSPSESGTFSLPVPAGPGVLKRVSQAAEGPERRIDVPVGGTLRVDLQ